MALSVGILAAMQAWGAVEDEFRPSAQIVYKTIGDVALQLHMFQPEGWNANDKRPALVFFFGGGWTGGTPQQFYPQSAHYAELGLVAFS
ncbi:MAG TPA: alpha/beta hydrolase, partial [Candidatus Hydrogenedentes bacterium]|nr:alpha/beta hydrolase [Candidatus Hydrogenedentota bacterium]